MLKFYTVDDKYLCYLNKFEDKVLWNKNATRPYIGVIFSINDTRYFVPLSSPKPKHKTMKNNKDFYKISDGRYGVMNFNKMIPVPDACLSRCNIHLCYKDCICILL